MFVKCLLLLLSRFLHCSGHIGLFLTRVGMVVFFGLGTSLLRCGIWVFGHPGCWGAWNFLCCARIRWVSFSTSVMKSSAVSIARNIELVGEGENKVRVGGSGGREGRKKGF